jgi:hypothetical protein
MSYELEKKIWTLSDFVKMGWHDNHIYKMRLTEDLEMDIDYILQWNKPDLEGLPFTFWVAPATLVFKSVQNLSFEFVTGPEDGFEIEDIERVNKNHWKISTRQGDIQFVSEGFEQFIRQNPSFQFGQTISYMERYGYSLDRVTNQANPNLLRDDIIEERKQNLAYYETVKKRHLKKQELENLIKSHNNNETDTRQYILKKKEISELIRSYDFLLKGTQFETW